MGRLIPAGTGMKRYQHVDITCNEQQKTLEKPKEEEFIIEENVDAYY